MKVTDALGNATEYSYDKLGNMLTMEDNTGITKYSYDALSRMTKMVTSQDQTVSYTYDAAGNRLTVQSGVNQLTTWILGTRDEN